MPLPKPTESKNTFMTRCIDDPNIKDEFKTINQRIAVCGNIYKNRAKLAKIEKEKQ